MKNGSIKYPIKFHSIGNQWHVLLEAMQSFENLSEKEMSGRIFSFFEYANELLRDNSISYSDLKSALTPPDASKYFDFCFIFDISKIGKVWYGEPVFKKFFKIITMDVFANTKNSIFSGDLLPDQIGFIESIRDIENQLSIRLTPIKTDYFVIFVSNLTLNQKSFIDGNFKNENYYVGAVNWTLKNNLLKRSLMLPSLGLKTKNSFIMPSPEHEYTSSIESLIPSTLKTVYFDETFFNIFLSYNYHSFVYSYNKDFSLNILNADSAEPITNYTLFVAPEKFNYLKKEKPHVIKYLGYETKSELTLEEFIESVGKSLSNNLFNIEINEYVTKFNTILDTSNKRIFFSFEYNKNDRIIRLITAY